MKEVEQLKSKLRQTKPNSAQALKSNANTFEKVSSATHNENKSRRNKMKILNHSA